MGQARDGFETITIKLLNYLDRIWSKAQLKNFLSLKIRNFLAPFFTLSSSNRIKKEFATVQKISYRVCRKLWPSYTKISNHYYFSLCLNHLNGNQKFKAQAHLPCIRVSRHTFFTLLACACVSQRSFFHFISATIPGTPCSTALAI